MRLKLEQRDLVDRLRKESAHLWNDILDIHCLEFVSSLEFREPTPVVKKTCIWKTKHDARSFVEKVDFVTTAANPKKEFKVITNLCTFVLKNGLLDIESIHPYSSLEEVKANTSWLITQTNIPFTSAPTKEELALLEKIDPNRIRYVEF